MFVLLVVFVILTTSLVILYNKQKPTQKYFGYYWIADTELKEVQNYCNCAVLDNTWQAQHNLPLLIQKDLDSLQFYRTSKLKAIIHVSGIFYQDILNKIPFDKETYTKNWYTYWKAIQPFVQSGDVLAFYLDEPPQESLQQLDGLRIVKQTIQQSNQELYTCIVLTANDIVQMNVNRYNVPDTIDWVGFDEYCCWESNQCFQSISIPDKIKILQNHNPNKKIILVGNGLKCDPSIPESYLVELNKKYLEICLQSENCVGMLIFAYNLGQNTVKQMPELERSLQITGEKIINNTIHHP